MKTAINNVEDAFTLLGRDRKAMEKAMTFLPEDMRDHYLADYDLKTLIEAHNFEANDNKHWIPNFNDSDEDKYQPAFRMWDDEGMPAGSGFSYYDCDYWDSSSRAGSRLVYFNYEVMRHVTTKYQDTYKRVFLTLPTNEKNS